MKLSELTSVLTGIDSKLTEASTELTKLIQDLRDALGDADIPAAAETALNAIQQKAEALANIVQ